MESFKVTGNRSELELLASLLVSKGIVFGEERFVRWNDVMNLLGNSTHIAVLGDTAIFLNDKDFNELNVNHVSFESAKNVIVKMSRIGKVDATTPETPTANAPINSLVTPASVKRTIGAGQGIITRRSDHTAWGLSVVSRQNITTPDKVMTLMKYVKNTPSGEFSAYFSALTDMYIERESIWTQMMANALDVEVSAAYGYLTNGTVHPNATLQIRPSIDSTGYAEVDDESMELEEVE